MIPTHCIFLLQPCSLASFCLCHFQNQCHRHLSWPLNGKEGAGGRGRGARGVNKWNINTPVSPNPLSMPSWGYWAEGPISGPSEPCKQHCQNPAPSRAHWLTLQTLCGGGYQAGWPVAGCCFREVRSVSNHSLSRLHGWTGRDAPKARGSVSIRSQVTRGRHTSVIARGGAENVLSAFKLGFLTLSLYVGLSVCTISFVLLSAQ